MSNASPSSRFRFWLWLIRLIGVIVPRRLRGDWRQELENRNIASLAPGWPVRGEAGCEKIEDKVSMFTLKKGDSQRGEQVVVLGYAYWQRRFGQNPDAIGKTLEIVNVKGMRRVLRIVGVMPSKFSFPDKDTPFWLPATAYWRYREKVRIDVDTWRVVE